MAVVYLATETQLSRRVAIKVLPPELTFGQAIERFVREAKTAAALDHPNIIPIYRVSSGGKVFWYAMKYLEGRSLEDVLREKQRLPLDQTIQILAAVADALDYAHQNNVIHRDVKPANVMLDLRNWVVVTDFGIAKALTDGTLTASGSVVGTPFYMSPEQGIGKGVSGCSDQYSVGVVAYKMLSGKVPFEGDSALDVLHKHMMVPPPPLETIQPGMPAHVYWAVYRALEKRPEARFPTVKEFVEALKRPTAELVASEAASEAATVVAAPAVPLPAPKAPPTQPPAPPTPHPTPHGRRAKLVMLTLGLAALIVAGLRWLPRFVDKSPAPVASSPADSAEASALPTDESVAQPEARRDSQDSGSPGVAAQGALSEKTAQTPSTQTATLPRPNTGRVIIAGLPSRGAVFVDNARQEPGTSFELAAGRHTLRLAAPGYTQQVTTITLAAGEELTVPFTGRTQPREEPRPTPPALPGGELGELGIIQVRISPWANVSLNRMKLGAQSLVQDTLLAGTHVLKFEREGFITVDTTIILRPGQQLRLNITMVRGRP